MNQNEEKTITSGAEPTSSTGPCVLLEHPLGDAVSSLPLLQSDYKAIKSTLSETLQNIIIQSEVSETLDTIIQDIELTHSINATLQTEDEIETLKQEKLQAERALEEYHAMAKERNLRNRKLADSFVKELLGISIYIEEFEEWKQKDEERARSYNSNDKSDGSTNDYNGAIAQTSMNDVYAENNKTITETVVDRKLGDLSTSEEKKTSIEEKRDDTVLQNVQNEATTMSNSSSAASIGTNSSSNNLKKTETNARQNESEITEDVRENPSSSPSPKNVAKMKNEETEVTALTTTPTVTSGPDAAAGEQVNPPSTPVSTPTVVDTDVPGPTTPITANTTVAITNKNDDSKKQDNPLPPPTISDFDGDLMMKIFEFMDAIEILNFAQTSIIMYSKVDSIFGLGGSIVSSPTKVEVVEDNEDIQLSESAIVASSTTEGINSDISSTEIKQSDSTSNVADSASVTATATTDANKTAPSSQTKTKEAAIATSSSSDSLPLKATIAQVPPPRKTKKAPSKSEGATTTAAETKNAIATQEVSSAIKKSSCDTSISSTKNKQMDLPSNTTKQSIKPSAPTTATIPPQKKKSSNDQQSTITNTANTSSSGGFQMSASVANSLAAKLTPVELSAIIAMRDELRKKDKEVVQLKEECEDLTSQLIGTVNVKETLTNKMKEMRIALDRGDDAAAKVARQTSSDQEVIAFLDDRVQELEKTVEVLQVEKAKIEGSVKKVKNGSEKQVRVMKDMLTFEREQLASGEREWKSTKKVLVKEVKLCRAQILALEAERDGFSEENTKLKEALLSIGHSSSRSKR